ncbi:SMI1/KNR4 family protein [Streptosporangium sp. H16]|uniref:SMI1/KNR4 family protein n=1 Tax=Streptosporangium sp. H16 TaxID=3444184 RepID=UPI003F7ADF6D
MNDAAQKYFAEYRAIPPEQRAGPDDGFGRVTWLGAPGAGEAEIARHEERLGMRLPPSYREFLQVTNGWDEYSHASLRLMPLAEVGWTRDVDPELARIWDQWYLHQESIPDSQQCPPRVRRRRSAPPRPADAPPLPNKSDRPHRGCRQ